MRKVLSIVLFTCIILLATTLAICLVYYEVHNAQCREQCTEAGFDHGEADGVEIDTSICRCSTWTIQEAK